MHCRLCIMHMTHSYVPSLTQWLLSSSSVANRVFGEHWWAAVYYSLILVAQRRTARKHANELKEGWQACEVNQFIGDGSSGFFGVGFPVRLCSKNTIFIQFVFRIGNTVITPSMDHPVQWISVFFLTFELQPVHQWMPNGKGCQNVLSAHACAMFVSGPPIGCPEICPIWTL